MTTNSMSVGCEDHLEEFALEILGEYGWKHVPGTDLVPGTEDGRDAWESPVLKSHFLAALRDLNPEVPNRFLEEAAASMLAPRSADPLEENLRFHEYLVHGYRGIVYTDAAGIEQNPTIRVLGEHPHENRFLAVNQVTIRNREHERRFDVVLYVNGLPLVIVELKKPAAKNDSVETAKAQLDTYVEEFPLAFTQSVLTVVSAGHEALYGTAFTPFNHYSPWNVDDDGKLAPESEYPQEILLAGLFNQERFLQLLRNFVAFSRGSAGADAADSGLIVKKVAKPHQYFAVTKAVGSTVQAVRSNGKAGVVWHTQGSGKSMEMELYAHLVAQKPELKNPTLVVVTDRNELDEQLYGTFSRSLLLGENPVQVMSRAELRDALADRRTGGIYFTTLQKFGLTEEEKKSGLTHPRLSDRRNIIVVVDEAHRSHYDDLDGYARHIRDALPGAAFIAFTGTPISFSDRNTEEVFGPIIDTYDLTRAVNDGATVAVGFEPRLVKVEFREGWTQADVDAAADSATEGLDDVERVRVERSVAVLNAVYGAPERLRVLAKDIVTHWETRREAMREFVGSPGSVGGKALIVGATREICARLYEEIVALRPEWHSDSVDSGVLKVVYSGSPKDKGLIAKHVRRGAQNKAIQNRLRNGEDELELVIVKDMMLTGFDAPPLHTLYLDRPLKGALLMQTLARVNRTYRAKPNGLLVAYAPLIDNLEAALAEYTEDDQREKPVGRNVDEAAELARALLAKLDSLCAGYDWRATAYSTTAGKGAWFKAGYALTNHLRSPSTQSNRAEDSPSGDETMRLAGEFRTFAGQLARAWALATGSESLHDIARDIRFYEEVRVLMGKFDAKERQARGEAVPAEVAQMLSAIIDESTDSMGVVDIYDAAGMPKPSLADLTPAFTKKAMAAENPHLAIEALRDLLLQETVNVTKRNLTRNAAFSEKLTELMNKYVNQQLTAVEIIEELIKLGQEIRDEASRGQKFSPPLEWNELALYDAIADNASAQQLMGDEVLAHIARELLKIMRRDVKTDWSVRDDVRAKLRASITRILIKFKYPPDGQTEAIKKVVEQMEELAKDMG